MPPTSDYKQSAKKAITDWLRGNLKVKNVTALRHRFNRISKSTFYRLLDECRAETGLREPLVIEGVIEAREIIEIGQASRAEEIEARLPPVITPAAVSRLTGFNAIELIRQCVADSDVVKKYCIAQDGRLKNAKLFLQASAHARASAETLSRIVERINDVQKMEQLLNCMVEEIRRESPEVADRIYRRLSVIFDTWGL